MALSSNFQSLWQSLIVTLRSKGKSSNYIVWDDYRTADRVLGAAGVPYIKLVTETPFCAEVTLEALLMSPTGRRLK